MIYAKVIKWGTENEIYIEARNMEELEKKATEAMERAGWDRYECYADIIEGGRL